jgi:hypothetical protein
MNSANCSFTASPSCPESPRSWPRRTPASASTPPAGALAQLRSRRPRRYDLVIPNAYLEDEKILLLLDIIRSDAFQQKALAMGGYEMHETGNVVDQI